MLKYLIVLLARNSVSYCHYPLQDSDSGGMSLFIKPETLSKIVFWAMKENLSIQFIYPDAPVPGNLQSVIESVDSVKIVPDTATDDKLLDIADIIVSHNLNPDNKLQDKIYIVRLRFSELVDSVVNLKKLLQQSIKVNVVLTDVKDFTNDHLAAYRAFLHEMSDFIVDETLKNNSIRLNLITDRMMLSEMNNCNAGYESIAVSHEGIFYPCPAFIDNKMMECGDVEHGFANPIQRLFEIKNAPICKICDAFHCKRCVWLNQGFTHEVNTPGWQQCVISHLEREAAKNTIEAIRRLVPGYMSEIEIPTINYIDPYTKIEKL